MGGLLALSAFFSGSETALFSLSPDGVRRLSKRGRVRVLLKILDDFPDELLTAILLGNLLVNILFFCTGAALSGRWASQYGGWFEAVGALVILFSVILFGEIVPKAVGVAHPQAVVVLTAAPLNLWFRFTSPFRRMLSTFLRVTRLQAVSSGGQQDLTLGELRELLDAVREEPGFGAREKEILEDILVLPDVRAREIMQPRTLLPRKPRCSSAAEMLEEARRCECLFVFVFEDREDDLIGCISVADLLLHPDQTGKDLPVRPLAFIPETRRADLLLQDFLSESWNVVAVVDEYGGFSGIVTLDRILSEVVSRPAAEGQPDIEQLDEDTYRLDGQVSIRAWRELFIGVLPEPKVEKLAFDTVGGLIASSLGRFPVDGDTISIRNLTLTVEKVLPGRIVSVLLHLKTSGETR